MFKFRKTHLQFSRYFKPAITLATLLCNPSTLSVTAVPPNAKMPSDITELKRAWYAIFIVSLHTDFPLLRSRKEMVLSFETILLM